MAGAPQVTVSIVSHGQSALVRKLVANLDAVSARGIARLIVTVNIAEPDMLEDLPQRFPGLCLELIVNKGRKGFGANHNQAFHGCQTPWFLVLNPDMHFDADVLVPLMTQAHSKSGLLAPRIHEPGQTTPEQHRALITPLEILLRRRNGYSIPTVPDWIPGLFMLFRSEAYRRVRGFDERFFMYGEDFDICARLQLADWNLQIGEELAALHDARRASHAKPKHLYWHIISLLKIWAGRVFWQFVSFKRAR